MNEDDENGSLFPREKKIDSLLAGYMARFKNATKSQATEYSDYVFRASKLTGDSYIVMHKRIERAFDGKDASFVLSRLRDWVIQTEKAGARNPAALFNWYFKQYREPKQTA